jgi:inner membrane protein
VAYYDIGWIKDRIRSCGAIQVPKINKERLMPTVFTHALVPLALGAALERRIVSGRLLVAGALCGALPDADVLSFQFAVVRGSLLSHRGLTHSLGFAALIGALAAVFAPQLKARRGVAFSFVGLSTLAHPLLDMLTNGGSGVALWFPFSSQRVFFSWRPILVAPISAARFFSERGWRVLQSELLWVWLPVSGLALLIWLARRGRKSAQGRIAD